MSVFLSDDDDDESNTIIISPTTMISGRNLLLNIPQGG